MNRWRSLLFVPAVEDARLAKAHERDADAIVLDLEDSIPAVDKERARRVAAAALRALAERQVDALVRINAPWRLAVRDLEAVLHARPAAIVIPKVESVAQLQTLAAIMQEIESECGLDETPIVALIESAEGVHAAHDIAQAPRVIGLGLGTEDFAAQMGAAPTPELLDLACRLVALAAATRRLMALATPVSIAMLDDIAAYAAAAQKARAFGATGGFCIHPKQASALNAAFVPSAEERAEAQAIVAAWDAAQGTGVIRHNGRMIDRPVVLMARRLLALPDANGQ